MSTKAAFITAMGGQGLPMGASPAFVRTSGDILTAAAHGLETGAGPFKVLNSNADAPSGIVVAKRAEILSQRLFVSKPGVIRCDSDAHLLRYLTERAAQQMF